MLNKVFCVLAVLVISGCASTEPEAKKAEKKEINNKWKGSWHKPDWQLNGSLEIRSVSTDSLSFLLFGSNGGHLGELEGVAAINGNSALYSSVSAYDSCVVKLLLYTLCKLDAAYFKIF